mmetsp:Transcript_173762/g.556915  ORF Transcript_173762/g.556915 Transcript_173762/m.556915 type:complete len:206 (+) Transcript_173762:689-1306(+)
MARTALRIGLLISFLLPMDGRTEIFRAASSARRRAVLDHRPRQRTLPRAAPPRWRCRTARQVRRRARRGTRGGSPWTAALRQRQHRQPRRRGGSAGRCAPRGATPQGSASGPQSELPQPASPPSDRPPGRNWLCSPRNRRYRRRTEAWLHRAAARAPWTAPALRPCSHTAAPPLQLPFPSPLDKQRSSAGTDGSGGVAGQAKRLT